MVGFDIEQAGAPTQSSEIVAVAEHNELPMFAVRVTVPEFGRFTLGKLACKLLPTVPVPTLVGEPEPTVMNKVAEVFAAALVTTDTLY